MYNRTQSCISFDHLTQLLVIHSSIQPHWPLFGSHFLFFVAHQLHISLDDFSSCYIFDSANIFIALFIMQWILSFRLFFIFPIQISFCHNQLKPYASVFAQSKASFQPLYWICVYEYVHTYVSHLVRSSSCEQITCCHQQRLFRQIFVFFLLYFR